MATHDSEIERLKARCQKWLPHRYARNDWNRVKARMDWEFSLIARKGHALAVQTAARVGQFLIHERIAFRLVGAGPCSILSYLLGLTEIDPLRYQLPAERMFSTRKITYSLMVDPRHAQQVQNHAGEQSGFESPVHIHPATEREIIPEIVARIIRRQCDPEFELRCIPLTDSRAGERLATGDFEGILPFESEDIQQAIGQLKPRSLEDLATLFTAYQIGIGRAGCFEEYVRRCLKQQTAERKPHSPKLLAETQGLVLYQEQVMFILQRIAEISLADGYALIRQAARGKSDPQFRRRFLSSAMENHSTAGEAENLMDELELIAGHTVCKAHQLASALPTWQAVYLKTHYPREFQQAIERIEIGSL